MTDGRSRGVDQPSSAALRYEADPAGHRVVARYGDGPIAFAFGSRGSRPGQFECPLDAVTVSPEFCGEPRHAGSLAGIVTPWVAVADYGNRRIQFFECDGAYIGEIDLDGGVPPCALSWRAPVLEVATVEGRRVRLHVAAAMLAVTHREDPTLDERPLPAAARTAWRVC